MRRSPRTAAPAARESPRGRVHRRRGAGTPRMPLACCRDARARGTMHRLSHRSVGRTQHARDLIEQPGIVTAEFETD